MTASYVVNMCDNCSISDWLSGVVLRLLFSCVALERIQGLVERLLTALGV